MGMISVSSNDKDIELTSLEAHVALCSQRQQSLEGKINNLTAQHELYKKIVIRAGIAIVTCTLSGITSILIHISGKFI